MLGLPKWLPFKSSRYRQEGRLITYGYITVRYGDDGIMNRENHWQISKTHSGEHKGRLPWDGEAQPRSWLFSNMFRSFHFRTLAHSIFAALSTFSFPNLDLLSPEKQFLLSKTSKGPSACMLIAPVLFLHSTNPSCHPTASCVTLIICLSWRLHPMWVTTCLRPWFSVHHHITSF